MWMSLVRNVVALSLIPAAAGVGLVDLESIAATLALACTAGLAAIAVAPPGAARNAFLAAFSVVASIAGGEVVLRVSGAGANLWELWQAGREVRFSGPMFRGDAAYGYSMMPNSAYTITVTRDGQLVYEVVYSIDAHGGRVTPPTNDGKVAIVLAGDSFNFGDGLRDDETLSFFLQQKSANRLRVPNIAVSGYGMHQVLRQLELDVPRRYGLSNFDWLVISVVDDHIERANGRYEWSRGSPRYVLDGAGRVKYEGSFEGADPPDWLKLLRTDSRLFFTLEQAWIRLMPTQDGHVFAAILATIQDLAMRKYHAKVLVLYHAEHAYFQEYVGRRALFHRLFQEAGVAFIDVFQSVPNIDASYFIPGDGHANAKLNAVLAEIVLRETGALVD
jgi:hypothetical protein